MAKLENMPSLIEHEMEGCKFAQISPLHDAHMEINALKEKISELEKKLNERNERSMEAEYVIKEIQEMASKISVRALTVVNTAKAASDSPP